jgi:Txe/YoeB family toxin of Txe-Axe toxin-antitoxin module
LKFGTTNPYVLKTIDPNYSRIEIPKKDRFIYVLKNKDKVAILSTLKHPIV